MISHWQKMQQLRLRYSQELQQQQQQQQHQHKLSRILQPRIGGAAAPSAPPIADSPVARIRNPLLDPTVDIHHLLCRRPCQHRSSAATREQETKAMLQCRLQRFFNSLPTCGPPPSLLPEPMRRLPDRATNNSSSLMTASQRAAPPTSQAAAAAADATLAESSCCCSTSNSLEHVTSNEDFSAVTPTSLPTPSPMMVTPPTAPQRHCHPVPQNPQQAQHPKSPQHPQQAQHPKSPQHPQQTQHPKSPQHPKPSAARNSQTPQHSGQQSHWRSRSSSLTQLTHNRRSLLVSGASQQYLHRLHQQQNQRQHQQHKQQQQQQHDYVSFGPTRESYSMPLSFKRRSASAGHRQHQQLQLPPQESQSAPPVPKPRSQQQQQQQHRRATQLASGGSAEATASRLACQVFHVTDVESVHASLISREDRRVLKILGQFECRAEVLDTVTIATKRRASIVYIAGPNVQHLNWCLDRIQDLFPAWELKGQMRGSCRSVR